MLKKISIILAVLIVLLLCSCNESEPVSPNTQPLHAEDILFDSVDELTDFVSGTSEESIYIEDIELSINMEDLKNTYVPSTEIIASSLDAEISSAEINGDFIYYTYEVENVDLDSYMERDDIIDTSENIKDSIYSKNNTINDAKNSTIEDDKVISEEMLSSCVEHIFIGTSISEDGESLLQSIVAMAPVDYWYEHPGFYYTTSPYMDMDDPLSYMIYWEYDGYFFQANIPSSQLEDFWEISDNLFEGRLRTLS